MIKEPDKLLIQYHGKGSPLTVQGITTGFKKAQPSIKIASARGTVEKPELVKKGDQIGVLKFNAWTGAEGEAYANAAFVSAVVNEKVHYGQKTVNADLILGCVNGIYTGEYVSINEKGVLSAKGIKIEHTLNETAERDKTQPWWLAGGTNFNYPVPITINTTSTGILIAQSGNFKQPALRFESYDDNPLKAGWTSFNRYRGTPNNPQPLKNGDFVYAFDWLGKADNEKPWEWGMAQTAVIDGDPSLGFLPTSMNWVTRSSPHAEPKIRVRISNDGTLTAYTGIKTNKIETIDDLLDLPLEEISEEEFLKNKTKKYFKTKINGKEFVLTAYTSG